MGTIDKIDFSKLKPYSGNVTKSFEQLCYQVAQKEYGHLGSFTPIDGSGGDGGVEFYLKLKTGEKWGWQCKFFGDNGRLGSSGRKKQIEDSLETACRNYPELDKWILCLKTNLTEDSTAPGGKISKGEQDWFKNQLPKKITVGRTVVLEHWGESEILSFLKSPKHIGIRSFFFGDLEFTHEWFKSRFIDNFEKVKDKYDQELHSIDKYTKSKIDFILLDPNYCKHIYLLKSDLLENSNQIEAALKEFQDERMTNPAEQVHRDDFLFFCNEFKKHIEFVLKKINSLNDYFENFEEDRLSDFNLKELNDDFYNYYNIIDVRIFDEESKSYKYASNIYYLISDFGNTYNNFFRDYFHETQKTLHFLGDAAKGKTHIACDIVYKRVMEDKPGIFITGDKFTDETNLSDALIKIIDIDRKFTFNEFIQSLDTYGSIVKCKIPIVIDGLNETTYNRYFSPIWKNHLGSFISIISQLRNIIIITTCRSFYVDEIWDKINGDNFIFLNGFRDYSTRQEAVDKYFKKYKLKVDLLFSSLERFQDPIFLKIFCELKTSPSGNEVEANLEEESSFDVFKQYLAQINKRVISKSSLFKRREQFISKSLSSLSRYLWERDIREIPLNDFYMLIDGDMRYEKDNSKADILLSEGLLIARDIRNSQEYVSFTYDILAGYLISKELVEINPNLEYFVSNDFINKIANKEGNHQLYEDIVSALCLLLPQLKLGTFHELIIRNQHKTKSPFFVKRNCPVSISKNLFNRRKFFEYVFIESILSLFKQSSDFIKLEDNKIVTKLFFDSDRNKNLFFESFFKVLSDTKHPFNALFFSKLLNGMPMNKRDINWTEYIRKRSDDIEVLISDFEIQCKNNSGESAIVIQKQLVLSKIVVWFLTSTHRKLRDLATRALYFYGRKFPKEFCSLVYDSLKINDPYVWERTLAALYGVTMAEHNSFNSSEFRNLLIPEICKNLYDLVFKENAEFSTTHILARDYARRTIEICLIYHPTILTQSEIANIRPPYKFGGIRDLGEHDYGDNDYDYSGPIRMDFSNYTLGRIVKDGHDYANPQEKLEVRRQIYWRIYNLGWSFELFNKVEASLGSDNYYNRARSKGSKIDRYGKKYSWIAYFENAGLRSDLGLFNMDSFRIPDADIDPSFPSKTNLELFILEDLLGDRAISIGDWYENGGMPFIENYLSLKNVADYNGEWICLDGFVSQEDAHAERSRFTFIRSFFINEEDYEEVLALLVKQDLGGRWLPEKHGNVYTFAGELYYSDEATSSNYTTLRFVTGIRKITIKIGDPDYYPNLIWNLDGDKITAREEFPAEIEQNVSETKSFEVLMPVMDYDWESYHSDLNDAGHTTVIAKEVANHLNLVNQPQTFDLFDSNGEIASANIDFHQDYNNYHNFVYLRKDLLDKFLRERNLRFVWAIWGERELTFRNDQRRQDFFRTNPYNGPQVFQKIIEYNDKVN